MIRVAVVGAGAIGRHHIRIYSEMPNVELVAIADQMESNAALSERYRVPFFTDHLRMLAELRPDAVSVAVPTSLHCRVGIDVVTYGASVLVEKPIASTIEEAEQLIAAACEQGVVLSVGHIERCNPAVVELKRLLEEQKLGRIFQIHARRWSPFPSRISDVGVTTDLATHDIDVMHFLTGARATRVFAETDRKAHASHEDLLSGLIRFDNGIIGVLDVNWLTPTKVRELTVFGERGMAQVNYLTQDVYVYHNRYIGNDWDSLSLFKGVGEGEMVRLYLEKREPLRVELESFMDAVAGKPAQVATGEDGLRALTVAQHLVAAGRAGTIVAGH